MGSTHGAGIFWSSLATAWLNTVAQLNGFEPVTHFQQTPPRGATIYRRVTQGVPKYPASCYSVPPLNAPNS